VADPIFALVPPLCYNKHMFKKVCIVAFVGLLFFNIAFAQNSTATEQDLLAVIKQLQTQIQSLQAQIADLQAEVQSVKLELRFSRALAQGATGDDVKQLQEFLKTFTGAYPDGSITGYFGPRTEAAVKKFQEQNGIASVGVVGPKTQEKLNVLAAAIPAATPCINCSPTITASTPIPTTQTTPAISSSGAGMSTTPAPSTGLGQTIPAILTTPATPCKTPSGVQVPFTPTVIKVISPNGGEQWQVGGTYTIKYSAKDIVDNKALLIYLNKGYDAPTTKTGVNSSQLIGVTTNLESYTYTVPNNIQSWPGLGDNYSISIYVEGSYSSCDTVSYIGDFSDATFSIVAGQDNTPATPAITSAVPVTSASGGGYGQPLQDHLLPTSAPTPIPGASVSAPSLPATSAAQDKTVVLITQINALENKLNSTTDTATRDSLMAQIIALKAQVQALQSGPATPTVQSPTPTLSVPTSASTPVPAANIPTTTSQAVSATQVPSIKVLSPNGGETLTIGKMYEIRWTGGNSAVAVWLLDSPTRLGKKIFSGITNDNYASWVVAPLSSSDLWNETKGTFAVPSGQYVMLVGCADNNCTVDDSDSYFKIISQ